MAAIYRAESVRLQRGARHFHPLQHPSERQGFYGLIPVTESIRLLQLHANAKTIFVSANIVNEEYVRDQFDRFIPNLVKILYIHSLLIVIEVDALDEIHDTLE